ncbi:MAG: LPS export ABC transporter permease LptF [Deltaproteobacteria bacterium]|nr:LPS export ABC transporter permease LptF [Deltaproteobacteria bacterium]
MRRTLFRYVCREVATPFLFGLLIFTFILLTARILKLVEMVVNRGVPVLQMCKIFLYVTPAFFEVTVPMAFLLALLWGLGRLSADREITALRSCGISLYQVALPVGVCTAIVLGGTFFLTLFVRPWSNTALKQVFYEVTKTRVTAGLKEKTFNDTFEGLVIYAEEIQPPGTFLRGVMIADSRDAQRKNTIFAHSGLVITNEDSRLLTLKLLDGTIHSVEPPSKSYQTTRFSVYDVTLNLATAFGEARKPDRDVEDMPLDELRQTIVQKQTEGADCRAELVEWHRRFSLPFASVVFGLIALPLSTQPTWSLRSHGFAVSLGIILAYYLLLTVGETLGKKGGLSPSLALWLPNMVLGSIGLGLFYTATQEGRFRGFSLWWNKRHVRDTALVPSRKT